MITDQNDPTGSGFFSRCARTTTKRKFKDKKRSDACNLYKTDYSSPERINTKKIVCPFDMVQSR